MLDSPCEYGNGEALATNITPPSGESLKQVALDLLETARPVYVRRARRALLNRLLEAGTATADDVRAAVDLPDAINPKLFGSVPGALVAAKIIRAAGFARTNRPAAHSRPVMVWHLVDRAAALDWLRSHPDLPDQAHENGSPHPQQPTLFDREGSSHPR